MKKRRSKTVKNNNKTIKNNHKTVKKCSYQENEKKMKKKTLVPGQNRTQDLSCRRHTHHLQGKLAGNAKKFEFLKIQYTSDSVKQVLNPRKFYFQI